MTTPSLICSVDGCAKSAATKDYGRRGMCQRHYKRWRAKNGAACKHDGCCRVRTTFGYCDVHWAQVCSRPCATAECSKIAYRGEFCSGCYEARRIARASQCSVRDCEAPSLARGFCSPHYRRFLDHGDPLAGGTFQGSDDIGLGAAHGRVRRLWGSASQYPCVSCNSAAKDWAYDGTDAAEKYGPQVSRGKEYWSRYSLYPEFYMPMCRKCHNARDSALAQEELRQFRQWKNSTGMSLSRLEMVNSRSEVA